MCKEIIYALFLKKMSREYVTVFSGRKISTLYKKKCIKELVSCPTRVGKKIGYTVHFRMTEMFKIRAQLSWKTWNWIEENAKGICYFGFPPLWISAFTRLNKSSIFYYSFFLYPIFKHTLVLPTTCLPSAFKKF